MEYKKVKSKKDRLLTGFTLIEILIVVVIMIILASIVLVSVGNVKNKAKDTAIKVNMKILSVTAKIFYDSTGSYENICSSSDFLRVKTEVEKNEPRGYYFYCKSKISPNEWAACAKLNLEKDAWCVDYSGAGKLIFVNICTQAIGGEGLSHCP